MIVPYSSTTPIFASWGWRDEPRRREDDDGAEEDDEVEEDEGMHILFAKVETEEKEKEK